MSRARKGPENNQCDNKGEEMFPMLQNSQNAELLAGILTLSSATYGLHELLLTSVGNCIVPMEK